MDAYPSDFDHPKTRHGIKFDATINLGHILTFVGFVVAGIGMYTTLDKRIQRQEDLAPFVQSAREEKDRLFQSSLSSLAADMKDVKTAVDRLNIKFEVQSAIGGDKRSERTRTPP